MLQLLTLTMLKIFQFSEIHKYNYKKNLMRLCMPNRNARIFFFGKILRQTHGRKLTTLSVFKLKRNIQKQCLCVFFTCFQSMFDKWQTYAFHVNDDRIYCNVLWLSPRCQSPCFSFWHTLRTRTLPSFEGGGSISLAWSRYTLMNSSRLLEIPPIVIWLVMWGLMSDIINSQPNSKLFVGVSLEFIAYIACLLTLLISRT